MYIKGGVFCFESYVDIGGDGLCEEKTSRYVRFGKIATVARAVLSVDTLAP